MQKHIKASASTPSLVFSQDDPCVSRKTPDIKPESPSANTLQTPLSSLSRSVSSSALSMPSQHIIRVLKELLEISAFDIISENDAYFERLLMQLEVENETDASNMSPQDIMASFTQCFWVEFAIAEAQAQLWQSGYLEHPGISIDSLANSLYHQNYSESFIDFCALSKSNKLAILKLDTHRLIPELASELALKALEKLKDCSTILKDYHMNALKQYLKEKRKLVGQEGNEDALYLSDSFAEFRQKISLKEKMTVKDAKEASALLKLPQPLRKP